MTPREVIAKLLIDSPSRPNVSAASILAALSEAGYWIAPKEPYRHGGCDRMGNCRMVFEMKAASTQKRQKPNDDE